MAPSQECTKCGKVIDEVAGAIHLKGHGVFCDRCHNAFVAEQLGIDFTHGELQPIEVTDVDGEKHVFHLRSRLVGTGRVMDAIEAREGKREGYAFSVMGEVDADPLELFAALYRRLLDALATQHVEEGDLGWRITRGDRLVGRIEWDDDEDGRVPRLVVDGRQFTWDEIGRMLMSYEGFTVEMTIRDRIEDLRDGGDAGGEPQ